MYSDFAKLYSSHRTMYSVVANLYNRHRAMLQSRQKVVYLDMAKLYIRNMDNGHLSRYSKPAL